MAQKPASRVLTKRRLDDLAGVGNLAVAVDESSKQILLLRSIPADLIPAESPLAQILQRIREPDEAPWPGEIQIARTSGQQGRVAAFFRGSNGVPLADQVKDPKITHESLLLKLMGVADAIDKFHESGQMHGDVGLNSVFESADGQKFELIHPGFHRRLLGWSGQSGTLPADGLGACLLVPGTDRSSRDQNTDRSQFAALLNLIAQSKSNDSLTAAIPIEEMASCRRMVERHLTSVAQAGRSRTTFQRLAIAAIVMALAVPAVKLAWRQSRRHSLDAAVDAQKASALQKIASSFSVPIPPQADVAILPAMASLAPDSNSLFEELQSNTSRMANLRSNEQRAWVLDKYSGSAVRQLEFSFDTQGGTDAGILMLSDSKIVARGDKRGKLKCKFICDSPPPELDVLTAEVELRTEKGAVLKSATFELKSGSTPKSAELQVECAPPAGAWQCEEIIELAVRFSSSKGQSTPSKPRHRVGFAEYDWKSYPTITVTPGSVRKTAALYQATTIQLSQGQRAELSAAGVIRPWSREAWEVAFGLTEGEVGPTGVTLAKNTSCYGFHPPGNQLLGEHAGGLIYRIGDSPWQAVDEANSSILAKDKGELQLGINSVKYRETATGRVDGDKARFANDPQRFWEDSGGFEIRIKVLNIQFSTRESSEEKLSLSKQF